MNKQLFGFIAATGLTIAAFTVALRMESSVEKYHDGVERQEAIADQEAKIDRNDLFSISIGGDPVFRLPARKETGSGSAIEIRAIQATSEGDK